MFNILHLICFCGIIANHTELTAAVSVNTEASAVVKTELYYVVYTPWLALLEGHTGHGDIRWVAHANPKRGGRKISGYKASLGYIVKLCIFSIRCNLHSFPGHL